MENKILATLGKIINKSILGLVLVDYMWETKKEYYAR
jgi:hypothetical protein